MKSLEGVELELQCACGHENFERVVVQRPPGAPIVTDFVACVGCRAMYFAPLPKADPRALGPGDKVAAIGPPGMIFFDASGREIGAARTVGFQNTSKFLETLGTAGL